MVLFGEGKGDFGKRGGSVWKLRLAQTSSHCSELKLIIYWPRSRLPERPAPKVPAIFCEGVDGVNWDGGDEVDDIGRQFS